MSNLLKLCYMILYLFSSELKSLEPIFDKSSFFRFMKLRSLFFRCHIPVLKSDDSEFEASHGLEFEIKDLHVLQEKSANKGIYASTPNNNEIDCLISF